LLARYVPQVWARNIPVGTSRIGHVTVRGIYISSQAVLILLICHAAAAQKTLSFNGEFQNARGETGVAKHNFHLEGDRSVLHGKFSFTSNYEDGSMCNFHVFRSANGEYAHGKKHGPWNYESRLLHLNVERIEGLRAITDLGEPAPEFRCNFRMAWPPGC
jgi:hypothetical protein